MLQILSHALVENLLPFTYPRNRRAFHAALAAFRAHTHGQEQAEDAAAVQEAAAGLPEEEEEEEKEEQEEEGEEEEKEKKESEEVEEREGEEMEPRVSRGRASKRQRLQASAAGQQRKGLRVRAARAAPMHVAPRILLLNTAQGGAGLNITQAQHVLFAGGWQAEVGRARTHKPAQAGQRHAQCIVRHGSR